MYVKIKTGGGTNGNAVIKIQKKDGSIYTFESNAVDLPSLVLEAARESGESCDGMGIYNSDGKLEEIISKL